MEDDTFFFGLFLWEDLGAAAVVRAAAGALVGVGLGLGLVVGHGPGRGPFRAKAGPEVLCLVGNRKKITMEYSAVQFFFLEIWGPF